MLKFPLPAIVIVEAWTLGFNFMEVLDPFTFAAKMKSVVEAGEGLA